MSPSTPRQLRPAVPGCPTWCRLHREHDGVIGLERSIDHTMPLVVVAVPTDDPEGVDLAVSVERLDYIDEHGRLSEGPTRVRVLGDRDELRLTSTQAVELAEHLLAAASTLAGFDSSRARS